MTNAPTQDTARTPIRIWILAMLTFLLAFLAAGCSVKKLAVNKLGDALASRSSGGTFSSDDLELIRDAVPFSLKLIEGLLAESPRRRGLLLAAASGFTQYSYAFVQQEAEALESRDLAVAQVRRDRARRLYLRARNYALRGLVLRVPGFEQALREDAAAATRRLRPQDVPLLYWAAASWGAAIALSKDGASGNCWCPWWPSPGSLAGWPRRWSRPPSPPSTPSSPKH